MVSGEKNPRTEKIQSGDVPVYPQDIMARRGPRGKHSPFQAGLLTSSPFGGLPVSFSRQ